MLLDALVSYAQELQARGEIPKDGWSTIKAQYALHIDSSGTLVDIVSLGVKEEKQKKTAIKYPAFSVPYRAKHQNGPTPFLLADNVKYLLGLAGEDGPNQKSLQCFESAKKLHNEVLKGVDDEKALAIQHFFAKWAPERWKQYPCIIDKIDGLLGASNLVFLFDDGAFAHENFKIAAAWDTYYQNVVLAPADAIRGTCLITGAKDVPIAKVHPAITGVPGARGTGVSLVSFGTNYNVCAYNYYGESQGYIAPTSLLAAAQYLTERQYEQAGTTMTSVVQNIGFKPKQLDMSIKSRCFSDKFTTDSDGAHTAIIPQAIQVDIHRMTEQERNVYLAICKYYMAQFLPPAKKEKSKLSIALVDGGTLTATATKTVSPGYLSIFKKDSDVEPDDLSPLCSLSPGTYVAEVKSAEVIEKETKPPARYTQSSLAADMTCIAKYVDDPKAKALLREKDKGKPDENGSIGTPATRASIILGLIKHGYLVDDGKHVISTQKAREFYRILPDEIKKADMTAYWWALQEDIRTGARDYHVLTDSVLETVTHIVNTQYPKLSDSLLAELAAGKEVGKPLGACPRCGSPVIEGKKGFGCSGWKNGCKFVIWKQSKVPMLQGTKVTATQVKAWLSGGWEEAENGMKISVKSVHFKKLLSQKGTTFEADLRLTDDSENPYGAGFKMLLSDSRSSLGKCPRCGGDIQEFQMGYSCSNRKKGGCGFVIWKQSKNRLLSKVSFSASDVKALLAGKAVKKNNLTKKDGSVFEASLKLKDDPQSPYGPDFDLVFNKT